MKIRAAFDRDVLPVVQLCFKKKKNKYEVSGSDVVGVSFPMIGVQEDKSMLRSRCLGILKPASPKHGPGTAITTQH
jgi:hypothetical protein